MKIAQSHVNMASNHASFSQTHVESATIELRADKNAVGAILNLSEEGELSYLQSMEKYEEEKEAARKEQEKQNWQNTFKLLAEQNDNVAKANKNLAFGHDEDFTVTLLKKMLELLKENR